MHSELVAWYAAGGIGASDDQDSLGCNLIRDSRRPGSSIPMALEPERSIGRASKEAFESLVRSLFTAE